MPQRKRHDTSVAIAVANENWTTGALPKMVWDEHVAQINLEDPTTDEVIATLDGGGLAVERYAEAHRALFALSEREHAVITRRFGFYTSLPMDFYEIADDLDIGLSTAYKRYNKAMSKMRRLLKAKHRRREVWWTGSEGYGW